jgi:hypothetical protein
MRKKFLLVWVAMIFLGIMPAVAAPDIGIGPNSAENMAGAVARSGGYGTNVTDTTLSESVGRIIKVVLSLVGTIFLALTIYAGILWMTAQGNEEQVTNATNILKRATVGLVITLAAYGITIFVLVAITASTGQQSKQIGGDVGAGGFWKSFGTQFKNNWYRYINP